MRKIYLFTFMVALLLSVFNVYAQENKSDKIHPNVILTPVGFEVTKPLRDNPIVSDMMLNDYEFVFNNHENRQLDPNITPPDFKNQPVDLSVQTQAAATNNRSTLKNFAGQNSGSYPPDTNGSVNSDYYFQVVNKTYAIYNKSDGSVAAGPSDLNSIFNSSLPGAGCNDGDPIVLWDEKANKWFYSEFSLCGSNDYMLIAVSQTDDPTGAWWSWSFDVDDTPDYMKFGIWRDGYYMATNTSSGNDVYVFDRATMITGGSNPTMIGFDNPNRPSTFDGFHCVLPLDNDGDWAASGTPGQFITIADDGQSNPNDALYIYELDADWGTPANSTFSRTQTLNVNAFDGNFTGDWNNIPQKGTSQKLDGLSTILMFRAQYRNFGSTQRLVVAHAIAEASDEAALRWYELENTGSGWSIRQQSTYNPDNVSRWNMSIAMNGNKEIAIGYSVSNANMYPGIRYIGQSSTANVSANNTLDIAETVIWDGTKSQTSYNRWGDYCTMSVDPSDDNTFWFTSEYMGSSTHGTRIASFEFAPATGSAPVANFSADDTTPSTSQTVTFTDSSSNSPTSWSWSFSPTTVTYVGGTSSSSQNPQVTFDATGDYSVTLTASNSYGNDDEVKNNYITASTPSITYCASKGNSVSDEYIQKVVLNTINNSSGAASGYTDHTSISTDLTKGESYTITVTPKWTGTIYNEAYAVWIDYNHNGDFTDSGELVWSKSASKDTPVSGTFTVPTSATETATRMRVSMKYNGIPTSCETFSYGEVEDYTINIIADAPDTEAPTAPTDLASSSVTQTSLNLSWTASTDNVAVTGYDVYQDGSKIDSTTSTSYSVSGLTAGTTYEFYVKAKDAAGNISSASSTLSVTTETPDTEAPSAPTDLASSSVTQTSLNLSWTASTDNVAVTGYDVYQDGSKIDSTTSTSYSVSGLTADTTYEFYVKAKDAAGNVSGASNTVSVTTEASSGGCTGGITSYPYNQGFENTFGSWTQASGDDFDWSLRSGSTPSSNTGPSSANEGSYYIYMESSSPNYSNKRAILNSPCFDLSSESSASLEFKYHMYGSSSMGSLAMEASTDDGSTWSSVWSKSGNQGNSWKTATIDLASYVGGTVKFRFNGITGTTWQGDMAVDDLSITGGGSGGGCENTTLSITFDNYPEETSWKIKDGSGTVVFSGGTYGSEADGSTKTIPICIDPGCYTFTIYDSYGDGICCSYGNGSYSYTQDSDSTVLASGASFTSSEATNFCISAHSSHRSGAHTNIADVIMYPIPVRNTLHVILKDKKMERYQITNMIGQTVLSGKLSNTIDLSQLKLGVYSIEFISNKKIISRRFIKQ